MGIEVVLGLQKLLCFGSAKVKLHPLLVDGLGDPLRLNSSLDQPVPDSIDALLRRGEQVVNLFRRIELPIRFGVWIRALGYMVSS